MRNTANVTYGEMLRDEALLTLQDTRGQLINRFQIRRKTAAGSGRMICSPHSLGQGGKWYIYIVARESCIRY